MKKIVIALLAVTLGYGLASAQPQAGQMGGETKKERKKMGEKKGKLSVCKGSVEAVDVAGGKITVKEDNGISMVMPVGPEAKIMTHGKAATLSDIMVGEMVHIKYEGDMANPMVKSVKVEKSRMHKEKMENKMAK